MAQDKKEEKGFLESTRISPITDEHRLILNNIFDTNPAARKKYIERLGYEMSPDDENLIREMGEDGAYTIEIDPGTFTAFKKGGLKAVLGEAVRDVGDVGIDIAESVGGGAVGAAVGAVKGAVAGPVGAVGGGVAGAMVGDALASAISEVGKNAVSEYLLDEDVPMDVLVSGLKTVLSGAGPLAAKGAKAGAAALKTRLQNMRTAFKETVKRGLNLSDEVVEMVAKNPENFTKEALEDAGSQFNSTFRSIFGIDEDKVGTKPPSQIRDGLFGKRMTELASEQDAALQSLNANRQFDVMPAELLQGVDQKINELTAKAARTTAEDSNLQYLRSFREDVMNVAKQNAEAIGLKTTKKSKLPDIDPITGAKRIVGSEDLNKIPLNHGQARQLLRRFQDIAWEQRKTGGGDLRQALGGGDGGMRQLLDTKAQGTPLPEINRKMHLLMDAYDSTASEMTSNKILSLPKPGTDDAKRSALSQQMKILDEQLGTNIGDALQSGAIDVEVKRLYSGAGKRVKPPQSLAESLPLGAGAAVKSVNTFTRAMKGLDPNETLSPDEAFRQLAKMTKDTQAAKGVEALGPIGSTMITGAVGVPAKSAGAALGSTMTTAPQQQGSTTGSQDDEVDENEIMRILRGE